jgi:hypothetical protein
MSGKIAEKLYQFQDYLPYVSRMFFPAEYSIMVKLISIIFAF